MLCMSASHVHLSTLLWQGAAHEEIGISGISDATLVAHSSIASKEGREYIVTAIAIGEEIPAGDLEGTALHWGCAGARGPSWQPPPHGWHTLPPTSKPAGTDI